jgi:hypothetical protein
MQQPPVPVAAHLEADFRAALNRIGFTPMEQEAIIEYTGCRNIAMLGLLSEDDITRMCKALRTRAIAPISLTILQEKLLLGVRFWISYWQRLQLPIEAEELTPALAFTQANIRAHMIEDEVRADKEVTAKMPDKFKSPLNWKIFSEAMETYLGQLKGTGHIPLSYVIRRLAQPPQDAQYQTELEQSIAMAPLIGPDYQRDNVRVYAIIKQLVLEGPGRSYIMPFDRISDGHAAWLALIGHFEDDSYRNRNVEDAYSSLERIHYEGERKGFNFEKFVEKHNEAFLELSRYGEPVLESKKVRDFLSRINAPELAAAKQQVRATPALLANFQEAANFIALSVTPLKIASRDIGAVDTRIGSTIQPDTESVLSPITQTTTNYGGRGTTMRGRGRARGFIRGTIPGRGRGYRGRGRMNPLRVSTSYYTPDQWAKLSPSQGSQILSARGTKRNISAADTDYPIPMTQDFSTYHYDNDYYLNPGDCYYETDPNTGTYTNPEDLKTEQEAVIDYSQNVSTLVTNITDSDQQSNAGDQFGQRSRAHIHDQSRYIGMLESSPRVQMRQSEDMTISRVNTIAETNVEAQEYRESFIELDSHVDTSCVGANCRIIGYTDKVCSVSPFHPKYKALANIPIVQAGTAYDEPETGKTYILVLNQSLYMGDALPNTLLNLNQVRSNNITVDDVLCQFGGTHSIFIPKHNLRIPLQLRGVFSCLPVRLPSIQEIETCEWIELTSTEEWNPKSSLLEEQEKAHQDAELMPRQARNRDIYPVITTSTSILHQSQAESPELTSAIYSAHSTSRKTVLMLLS